MIAMTPLIAIQILGLMYKKKQRKAKETTERRRVHDSVMEEKEDVHEQ
jgi:hypothetical protein